MVGLFYIPLDQELFDVILCSGLKFTPPPTYTHTGRVVAVDEDNAYSWPVCDICGNQQLSDTARYVCG